MFSFFESLASIFSTIVDYIVGFVELLISLFLAMLSFGNYFFTMVPLLPEFIFAPAILMIAVVFVLNVLNRGT